MVSLFVVVLHFSFLLYIGRRLSLYDEKIEAIYCILAWLNGKQSKISSDLIKYYNGEELSKRPFGGFCESYSYLATPEKKLNDENYQKLYRKYQQTLLIYFLLLGIFFLGIYSFEWFEPFYTRAYVFIKKMIDVFSLTPTLPNK